MPPDATAIEVAARMAGVRSPIIAVIDGATLLGAITVSGLLAHGATDVADAASRVAGTVAARGRGDIEGRAPCSRRRLS